MADRAHEIAVAAGVERSELLQPSEVVQFEIQDDGSCRFVLSSGKVLRSIGIRDVDKIERAAQSMPAADLANLRHVLDDMRSMFQEMERMAPDAKIGVPLYRRRVLVNGQPCVRFLEAGRE